MPPVRFATSVTFPARGFSSKFVPDERASSHLFLIILRMEKCFSSSGYFTYICYI